MSYFSSQAINIPDGWAIDITATNWAWKTDASRHSVPFDEMMRHIAVNWKENGYQPERPDTVYPIPKGVLIDIPERFKAEYDKKVSGMLDNSGKTAGDILVEQYGSKETIEEYNKRLERNLGLDEAYNRMLKLQGDLYWKTCREMMRKFSYARYVIIYQVESGHAEVVDFALDVVPFARS